MQGCAGMTCGAGLRAGLSEHGQSPSGDGSGCKEQGSVLWVGLSGSQSAFPGALRAWAVLGDGGGWSQCPGTSQLQPHPIPLIPSEWDVVGRTPKQICSSIFSYLFKKSKHLRNFRGNRAVLFIHLLLW